MKMQAVNPPYYQWVTFIGQENQKLWYHTLLVIDDNHTHSQWTCCDEQGNMYMYYATHAMLVVPNTQQQYIISEMYDSEWNLLKQNVWEEDELLPWTNKHS